MSIIILREGCSPSPLTGNATVAIDMKERWTIELESDSEGGAPMALRVRKLLKTALRFYGLRAVGYGLNGQRLDGPTVPRAAAEQNVRENASGGRGGGL